MNIATEQSMLMELKQIRFSLNNIVYELKIRNENDAALKKLVEKEFEEEEINEKDSP
jgi:hypothetical protein